MLDLDRQSRVPIYEQLAEGYKTLIAGGVLAANELLPSQECMARELSLNPHTIRKALEILEEEGYIYSVDKGENYVSMRGKWEKQEQKAFFDSLAQMVRRGKRLHISREEFLCHMEKYYGEEA